jgi:hypothetical protein
VIVAACGEAALGRLRSRNAPAAHAAVRLSRTAGPEHHERCNEQGLDTSRECLPPTISIPKSNHHGGLSHYFVLKFTYV